MAEIRVILKFDYPPPTGPESRHLWMLLNPDHLRTVTDLSELIRGRYYPNQRGALCLYVHDCLLPPGESARLVRDNDVIRVQWQGYDPEDDDMDGPTHPAKKRSRQRCEEDHAGDRPTIIAKKRKCEPQPAESPRGRKEMVVLEECEQEEATKNSRKKAKKKKVLALQPGNKSNNEPPGRSADQTSSSDSEPSTDQGSSTKRKEPPKRLHKSRTLTSVNKTKPSHELPAEGATKSSLCESSGSSSDQESSTKRKESPKVHKKAGTVVSVNKTKPNAELPAKSATKSSSHVSSGSSSDQESSTKRKGPPKRLHKSRTLTSVNKTKPNHELAAEGATKSSLGDSSGSSSDQESSTKRKESPKVHKKVGTVVSVNKTKPNPELPAKSATKSSFCDSSGSSSDQESSTKRKEPPKVHKKAGTVASINKNKPNPELPAKSATKSSFSDSSGSSSDQESSTKRKDPPNVLSKDDATVSGHTNPNIDPSAMRTRSRIDYTASSCDQELSTARKNPPEASRNPSDSGRTTFSSEMRKSKNNCALDNGDIRRRRSVDVGTVPPLNGTSQKPPKEAPSSGSDLDTNVLEPGAAQYSSRVTNGGETGGIHQGPEPNPSLYDHGRGRGRGIFPWRGQGGRGFRGWGDRGRGRGFGNQFFHSYDSPSLKKQQLEEEATNTSVVIQNPPESPRKDYSTFPLLAAPPQVGKVIAFKILELDENYSPELSDYKEGVVRGVDPVTLQVEVELLSKQKKREPGKFDLVYELENGKEIVEFAVLPECKIKEPWSSLITPRLVMDMGSEEGTSAQTL